MTSFHKFARLIHARFVELSKHELFTVAASGDSMWDYYLSAFPEGTNPIYRERTEHDCSCCRQFIRNIANVVAIVDGKLESVWNVEGAEHPYDVVAQSLRVFVEDQPIAGLFRSSERKYGAEQTIELLADGKTKEWKHFHAVVSDRHFSKQVDKDRGDYLTTVKVFKRGLLELSAGAFQTAIDLIDNKSIYRGEECLPAIKAFQKLQKHGQKLKSEDDFRIFAWANANNPAARFRNTAIGTLIQDLSAGVELEAAVKSFESKVAPTNYKRPTALITPRMVQDAMKTIQDLGLEPALERRFAKLPDVSVNNVLWVDNSVQSQMKDGIEGLLMGAAKSKPKGDVKAEDIGIDEFMAKILPQATSMEIQVKNTLAPNFMSLTAPVYADSGKLFKWNNDFAWSYNGNITDSIKEKVKRAGGNADAPLRVSLAWFNPDDLDIHCRGPEGHIYFGDKKNVLDVDMNAWGTSSATEPVENLQWVSPRDGAYKIVVNQYSRRTKDRPGFVLEVENNGQINQYSYPGIVAGDVSALTFKLKNGAITDLRVGEGLSGRGIQQETWGIKTETFVKVNTLMKSPNHWDGNEVGNKHWFFMLDGCFNPEPTRGIYNEFLNSGLDKHRKVFEILGDKTKCQPTTDQLSGLGFSSTRGDTVLVNVTGAKLRKSYNITF